MVFVLKQDGGALDLSGMVVTYQLWSAADGRTVWRVVAHTPQDSSKPFSLWSFPSTEEAKAAIVRLFRAVEAGLIVIRPEHWVPENASPTLTGVDPTNSAPRLARRIVTRG